MHEYHDVEQVLCVYFSAPLRRINGPVRGSSFEEQLCCCFFCVFWHHNNLSFKRLMCSDIFHM